MEPDKTTPLDPLTKVALESLKDIAVPQPVSWMPQTWGWSLVAVLFAFAVVAILLHRVRLYRANAYRREALGLLDGMEAKLQNAAERDQALCDLAEVLKRTALAGWGRADVAALSGAAWVAFLEEHGDRQNGHVLAALLDDGEYRNGSGAAAPTSDDTLSSARNWIRRHHVSA
ncbi:DUF4381 domain-containing protein [Shinella sp.]|uniref:DUF4381 domain-containing protein n=1 Tax=Shinella sp. TaxID=1870904 RepID=UPI004035236A